MSSLAPRRRTDRIVVRELSNEVLVYDLEGHRACCLNVTAAVVWRHCDGHTTVSEIAEALQAELSVPADEQMVWLALEALRKANMLEAEPDLAAAADLPTRREWARKLSAALVPAVVSIVAPTAAAAQSTIAPKLCRSLTPPCPGVACAGKGKQRFCVSFQGKCACR